jgi:hypothetical protein
MNNIENKLEELNSSELEGINAGGEKGDFFYDLGFAAHDAFESVADFFKNNDFGTIHSAG